MEKEEYIFLIF